MSRYYLFNLMAAGKGDTLEEAWRDCQENYDINKAEMPEEGEYSFEEEED